MKLAILVAAAITFAAPAASAQASTCQAAADGPQKATKQFVEAYSSGQQALRSRDWQSALTAADEARLNATDTTQTQAALAVRTSALAGLKDDVRLIETVKTSLALGCLPDAIVANLTGVLNSARGRLAAQQQ